MLDLESPSLQLEKDFILLRKIIFPLFSKFSLVIKNVIVRFRRNSYLDDFFFFQQQQKKKELKMNKRYTRRQICEAIKHWQKQLKQMDEGFELTGDLNLCQYAVESNMKHGDVIDGKFYLS